MGLGLEGARRRDENRPPREMRTIALASIALLVCGCAQAPVPAQRPVLNEPLENTYWKLTHLGDAPVVAPERQREAHFILHPSDQRVSGSGGCNRFTGGYELAGDRLTFGRMAATMMACADAMDTEKAFLSALQQAARARTKGPQLELLDASGSVVARFEAVHPR
jgi:heat shock protein HslJ